MTAIVGIVVQARWGSSRLPGKVLMPLAGMPMLTRIIHRLRQCREAGMLIVATSSGDADAPVAALAETEGAAVFRGDEADVLDRFYRCAREHRLDAIVRATGDNPFVDAEEADRLIRHHRDNGLDHATSFDGGLPVGIGVEVFSRAALETSWQDGTAPQHREHVNEYILENPHLFRTAILQAPAAKTAPEMSFTVDTRDQFERAEGLYADFLAQFPDREPDTAWLIARASQTARSRSAAR